MATRDKHDEIAALVKPFCQERLTQEHEALCLKLLEKLCRKRPSPVINGSARAWAAGVVYAICAANAVFSKRSPLHMSAGDISSHFGASKKYAGVRASQLRIMFRVYGNNPAWTLPPTENADYTDIFTRFDHKKP